MIDLGIACQYKSTVKREGISRWHLATMSEKYGVIFDAIVKRNVEGHNSGNADAILEMYDDSAVVVDKKQGKIFFGVDQIMPMMEQFVVMGKVEFKNSNLNIIDLDGDRFYTSSDFETKFVDSGVVMTGSIEQLFHKKGDQYKCVYECFAMQ